MASQYQVRIIFIIPVKSVHEGNDYTAHAKYFFLQTKFLSNRFTRTKNQLAINFKNFKKLDVSVLAVVIYTSVFSPMPALTNLFTNVQHIGPSVDSKFAAFHLTRVDIVQC